MADKPDNRPDVTVARLAAGDWGVLSTDELRAWSRDPTPYVLAAGLGRPDVNVPLILDGRRVVPDFRWPGRKLIVEADSRTWHDNKLAREDDAERQALLEEHGERVVRVTWAQAIVDRPRTMKRLRAAAGFQ